MNRVGLFIPNLDSDDSKNLIVSARDFYQKNNSQLFAFIVHGKDLEDGVFDCQNSACKALATKNNIDEVISLASDQIQFPILNDNSLSDEGKYFLLINQMYLYQYFLQDLQATADSNETKELLINYFNRFGIASCVCCIYDEPRIYNPKEEFVLPDEAEVFFAYNEDGIFCKDSPVKINPSKNMYPPDFSFCKNKEVIVTALFNHEKQYGYLLYTPGDFEYTIYQLITSTTGIALAANSFYAKKVLENELLSSEKKFLETETYYDQMTGALNRRGLFKFGVPLMQSAIERNLNGGIIFCDMDYLKKINDEFGHEAGNRAIKGEVEILNNVFRTQDVIARLGGDEFLVVACGVDAKPFGKIKKRINDAIEKYNQEHNEPFTLSLSVGYVEFNKQNNDLNKLMKIADERQYEEKVRHHKNRV